MRANEFISEAKGLFGRKIGDKFKNDNGVEAEFQGIEVFPSQKANSGYQTLEKAQAAAEKMEASLNGDIEWVNAPTQAARSFAIATLKGIDNKTYYWGRWYGPVPGVLTGTWPNTKVPPGWKLQTRAALKSRSGMSPQDLIKTEKFFPSADSIIKTVAKNGAEPAIIEGLTMAAAGKMPIFKDMKDREPEVRDFLGEIVQPIAIMSGLVKGDIDKARQEILGVPFADCQVNWPQSRSHNLVDSIFTNPSTGATLGISTKGNKGANASVNNIYAAIVKAQNQKNTKLLKAHPTTVKIVTDLATKTSIKGPIEMAVEYRLITKRLANEILDLIRITKVNTRGLSPEAKNLFSMYGSRSSSPGFNIGYVLVSNTAKMLAEKINNDPNFGKGCLAFLNQSSIVQIYTTTGINGNDVIFNGFRSVYPPNFSGTILVDAGKNYTSTDIKGKMTFKLS